MNRKLFKDGIVLTLDPSIGDFKKADMLVEGATITEIQPNIEASDCEVIDCSNRIVMPGLVDAHRHTWESVVRNVGADWSLPTYLGSIYYGNIGSKRSPQNDYIGNLLGALEALDAGVTTQLDSSMIISPEHADEMVRGLRESGTRAVFAHGPPGDGDYWNQESERLHPDDARRVKEKHFSSKDQLLTMGLAIRGPEFSSWDTTVQDIHFARELDTVCSMHLGFGTWGASERSIERLNSAGLLGADLNFAHANAVSPEEMKMLAAKGGSISVTPEIEMMMGHGYPATGLALENGVRPSLGVDVTTSTSGEMFTQMKFTLQAERSRVNEQLLANGEMPGKLHIAARDVLEFATLDGAKALLLDNKIGTLTPGKEADIITVRTDDWNMFPINDPIGAVTQSAQTKNVDAVFVAGNAVKRDGQLVNVDLERVRQQATQARDSIFHEYGKPDGVWFG
ncbi:amidohydrolase family protein [Salicibibacter kimchii]|uniref:Amidohydrolase-related domain-containing protein n=1 Tax=Salicibibacter kimchii TaxID=2099786 RepID=A0A345C2X3_9BACI|nr:amidohydrolase family protein [Salicibibacter kimchii]AXF57554.1 hypothetical protein DT065_17225 [Salicibibacter kimchii]